MSLLATLATILKGHIDQEKLILSPSVGQGSIRGFDLGPNLTMLLAQCELVQDLNLSRKAADESSGAVTFSFRHVFSSLSDQKEGHFSTQASRRLPSVQVSSDAVEVDLFFPAKTPINTILITTQVDILRSLLHQPSANPILQSILSQTQPFVYEELISADILVVATQLVSAPVPQPLHTFYLKIKAQELICLFFVELLKRQDTVSYPVNGADVKRMYQLQDKLLADLSQPPNLPELASFVGMSESKMKRLFKQIFGASIYAYYQNFRMKEAAYLIKERKLSITETGLQLGFTNLSHFSRIFEKHMGQKPKKYSIH